MSQPVVVNIIPINGQTSDGLYKTNRDTIQSLFSNDRIIEKIENGWIQGGLTHKNRNVDLSEVDPTTVGISPSESLLAYGKGTHFFRKIWVNESAGYVRGLLVPLDINTPESNTVKEYIDNNVTFGVSVVIKLRKSQSGHIIIDDLLGIDVTIGPYFPGCTRVEPDKYDLEFIEGPEKCPKYPSTFSRREPGSYTDYVVMDKEKTFSARDYLRQIQKPLPEFLRYNFEDIKRTFNQNSGKPDIQKALLDYLSFMIDNLIISVGEKAGSKVDIVKALQLNRYGNKVTQSARLLNREYVRLLTEKSKNKPISAMIQNRFSKASKDFKQAFIDYFISKTNSKDFGKTLVPKSEAKSTNQPNKEITESAKDNVMTASKSSNRITFSDSATEVQVAEAGIQSRLLGTSLPDIFYTEYLYQLQLLIQELSNLDFSMRRIYSEPYIKISAEALKFKGEITIVVELMVLPKYHVVFEYKVMRNQNDYKDILTTCKYLGQMIYNGNSMNSPLDAFHKLSMMGGAGFDMRNVCRSMRFCRIGLVGLII